MDNKDNNTREYYHKNVVDTWSTQKYKKYKNSNWRWADLPFRDYISLGKLLFKEYRNHTLTERIKNKSILEVGSAMGSAYEFMKDSSLVDLSQYTGIEVSKVGVDYCKKKFPEANWIHQDFTTLTQLDSVDYSFERNAIHHMPDPLKAYDKLFKATNVAFSTCFRSCLKGETISDLEISNFKTSNGVYYSSIINLFEVIKLGLNYGFNNIKVTYGGPHEIISNDPKDDHFIDPKIDQKDIFLSRCKVHMIKTNIDKNPNITFVARPDVILKNFKAIRLINKELKKIKRTFSK